MRLIIQADYEKACLWTANYIAQKINSGSQDKPFVLGLPTGSSPLGIYRNFIKMFKEGKLTEINKEVRRVSIFTYTF